MLPYKDLLDLVKKSDFTLIGYTFKEERLKDEFISNFSFIEIDEISSSFSFKSFLRDLKLKSILENGESVKNPEYILLDISNIRIEEKDSLGGRQKVIRKIIEKIREDVYRDYSSEFPAKPQYKVIFTCSLYNSGTNSNDNEISNFSGGSVSIFTSDLVLSIKDNKIKVLKNRFGNNGDEIVYNFQDNKKTIIFA